MEPEAQDPDHIRASDQDRQRVADQLHTAADEGRLSLVELDERLAVAYAARTYGELVPLTRDLPVPGAPSGLAAASRDATVIPPGVTGPGSSIAIMGSSSRSGEWVVPAQHTAVALMGGVELDLRHARFAAPEVTIIAIAIMGGVDITVPHDLDVEVDGIGFMGGFEGKGAGHRTGGPRLRVTGFAMMGAVNVTRAKPDKAVNLDKELT